MGGLSDETWTIGGYMCGFDYYAIFCQRALQFFIGPSFVNKGHISLLRSIQFGGSKVPFLCGYLAMNLF